MANSEELKEQFYIESVDDSDFEDIQKEYVYLKRDEKGIYFFDRSGKREDVVLPYIPVIDDNSTVRILFKKREGEENKRFKYAMIDNDERILNLLENKEARTAIGWRIKPNKKLKNIKKDSNYKNYIYAKEISFFDEETKKLTGSNVTLHKLVMSVFCKDAVKRYNNINKKTARSLHIDHLNNDEFDCRLRNLSIIEANQNYESKKEIDSKEFLDSFVIYRPKNEKDEYIDKKKKYILILFLGKGEFEGKTVCNFVANKNGSADVICLMFNDIESVIKIYNKIYVKDGNKLENADIRNKKIRQLCKEYAEDKEKRKEYKENGIKKLVTLARGSEIEGNIDFYYLFSEKKKKEKTKFTTQKRGLVIEQVKDEKINDTVYILKSRQTIEVNSQNITDTLFCKIKEIFDL